MYTDGGPFVNMNRITVNQSMRWALASWVLCAYLVAVVAKDSKGNTFGDLDEDEKQRICYNFTTGNIERKEFYSPLYNQSGTYPNNTECVKVISAPPNHMVRLEFRDKFHMEESPSCEFDYLEILNGGHVYSPLEAKVCGREFPKPITSEGRELFLRFISDASIEYVGFKAVYSYAAAPKSNEPPPEDCQFTRNGTHGKLGFADIKNSQIQHTKQTGIAIDCTWTVRVPENWKIYLTFLEYKLGQPNQCGQNFVDIISQGGKKERLRHFCGTIAEPTPTTTNEVQIRYFAHATALTGVKLSILFTAYREAPDTNECDPKTEFSCDDGWCIDQALMCDGDFNCKYRYDEDVARCIKSGPVTSVLTSEHMIIILVVFSALVMGMCASITITCYNKIQERRDREREYKMRRSKEVSMEIGLAPPAAPSSELEAALAAEIRLRKQHQQGQQMLDDEDNGRFLPEVDLQAFRKHPNGVLIMTGSGPVCTDGDHQSMGDRQSVKSVPLCPQHGIYRDNALNRDSLTPPIPPPPPPPLQAYYRMRDPPSSDMSGRWSPLDDSTHASSPQGPSAQSGETGRPDLVARTPAYP